MQMSFVYGKSSDVYRETKYIEGGWKFEAAFWYNSIVFEGGEEEIF